MQRQSSLAALAEEVFDLLIIGGGITGCGVAREAARRGLRTALVEAGDFAGGTSSRSTKLIHGGLRYLKEFDFQLVREAVSERQRLVAAAPHLVRPIWFVFPVYRGDPDPLWKLRIGLWLYDRYAGPTLGGYRHRPLPPARLLEEEPLLRRQDLVGGAMYTDSVTDDARLTVTVARAAAAAGAVLANHAAVVGFLRDGSGRVTGARVEDRLAPGTVIEVRARKVLNATGPWGDQVRRLDEPEASRLLRLTKGIHLAFPRQRLPLRHAVTMRGPDGRIMFAVPRGDFAYAGTTDTVYEGDPGRPLVEPQDARYVLEAVNRNFPGAGLEPGDVISAWAGLRPLIDPGDTRSPGAISRDYKLFTSPSGLVTVAGGKLTAYRAMAEKIVDEVFPATRGAPVDAEPLPGGDRLPSAAEIDQAAAAHGLDRRQVEVLVGRYGGDFGSVLEELEPGAAPAPAAPQSGDAGVQDARVRRIRAEARWAVRREMAQTLGDLLWRRAPEGLWSHDNGRSVAAAAAEVMGDLLGWDQRRRQAEIDAYLQQVETMHAWKAGV
ncbi:MAG: glycerol-3-phosphate dehydrogenase/oxidase [Thermaerobacter sp.]|nr:glycerol-3-phosphate dehydrogenase/oxidase [Bacillota bacterium]REJ37990.1 MAG: glycerol-3-phosphate dehydrogenase/oxidase [Bacillota bacterium]